MKRYLHLSSFFLCKCVDATLMVHIITAILSDVNITKHRCGTRGKTEHIFSLSNLLSL